MKSHLARRAKTAEAEMMRKAAAAFAGREPGRPLEVLDDIAGQAGAYAALGEAVLIYAETLAAMNADPRIVREMTDTAMSVTDVGGQWARLARKFSTLYAGDLEQDERGSGRRMTYPKAS